ncbi:MAG: hypothetical protein Q8873_09545, partial [Bacillota bacterium]|nr:hypothetical protein [Bacillota bacterium]
DVNNFFKHGKVWPSSEMRLFVSMVFTFLLRRRESIPKLTAVIEQVYSHGTGRQFAGDRN